MDSDNLKAMLMQVQSGQMDLDTALHQLKKLPFEDIGYAKVDTRCSHQSALTVSQLRSLMNLVVEQPHTGELQQLKSTVTLPG